MVWANWDVEELKEKAQAIVENNLLTIGLKGLGDGSFTGLK